MKLHIERQFVEQLIDRFLHLSWLKEQLRLGNKAEVSYTQFTSAERHYLQLLYSQAGADQQYQVALLLTLQQALENDSVRFQAEQLEQLLPELAHYLIDTAIRG